jgi:hypothetical protein
VKCRSAPLNYEFVSHYAKNSNSLCIFLYLFHHFVITFEQFSLIYIYIVLSLFFFFSVYFFIFVRPFYNNFWTIFSHIYLRCVITLSFYSLSYIWSIWWEKIKSYQKLSLNSCINIIALPFLMRKCSVFAHILEEVVIC